MKSACSALELSKLKYTMTVCFTEIIKRDDLKANTEWTLFRGIENKLNVKANGFWSSFTSTSFNINIAKKFSYP